MRRNRSATISFLALCLIALLSSWLSTQGIRPPKFSDDELRYSLGGVCPDMTRAAVERIAGPGKPALFAGNPSRTFEYPWGELLYNEREWVAWAHGAPLLDRGNPVVRAGDTEAQVVAALGRPTEEFRFGTDLRLGWPRYRLTVQFLDKRVHLCTLKSRYAQEYQQQTED